MSNKNIILIIGSSSYLGKHLLMYLDSDKTIYTHYTKPFKNSIFFDLEESNIDEILKKNPNINKAIILAGMHNYKTINNNAKKAYKINVLKIKKILKLLKSNNIVPIYTSSDNVFDGIKGYYKESDKTNPKFSYAIQKVEIEKFILNNFDKYQIYRISKIIDRNLESDTLIANWIKKIKKNEKIVCASDNSFSPIDIEDLCIFISRLIKIDETGIFHLSSNENLSRKEMLDEILEKMPKEITYTQSISYKKLNEFKDSKNQPIHISLNSEKVIQITNHTPKKYSEVLSKALQDLE